MVTATSKPPVEFQVRWKDGRGTFNARRRRALESVQLVLELRWSYGNDFPIQIAQRPATKRYGRPEWEPSSWDEIIAHIPVTELPGLRLRQGWVEPYWWRDR